MNMLQRGWKWSLGIAVLLLAGCAGGVPHLEKISELSGDEVVLVGRIELVPPLSELEQELKTASSGRFRGKGHAIIGDKLLDLDNLPISAGKTSVLFEFGKDFFVRKERMPAYSYSGSVVLLRSTASSSGYMGRDVSIDVSQLKLPGRIKYVLAPADRAVYLGTLRYHRDDYNAITKVEYIDEFTRVNQEFTRRFGTSVKLRRIAPQQIK